MSSSNRNGLLSLLGFGAVTVLGAGALFGVHKFNSTYGPVINEMERFETAASMTTEDASLRVNQAAKNLSYSSEEEREQKLLNVSLNVAQPLHQDGLRYEQLNSDPTLNNIVYPVDQIINPRLSMAGSSVPAKLPAGYIGAGLLTAAGLYGVVRGIRGLRQA